jgi:hypothetical protein
MRQWSCPGNAERKEPWKNTEAARVTPTHKTLCMTEAAVTGAKCCQYATNDTHRFLFDARLQ